MYKVILSIIIVAYLLFTGCNTLVKNNYEHIESEENIQSEGAEYESLEPLSYTIYTDKIELFVEFSPLIVGEVTTFVTHFTKLKNFKPITHGQLAVSIEGNIEQTVNVEKPSSPGIFLLSLEPEQAGIYQLVFKISSDDFSDKIIIENVNVFQDEETAMLNYPEPIHEGITYLKEQAWKTDFANLEVKRQPFFDIIRTSGEILPAQGDEVVITAKTNGIVLFIKNTIFAGRFINKGDNLFTISGSNLIEENLAIKYKQSRANFEKCSKDYDRAKELIKNKLISEKEFLEIKVNYENSKAAFENIAQNYDNGGNRVNAPINGYIKKVYVAEGQYVKIGQIIASIAQNQRLVIKAEVSQNYFPKLPAIFSANFRTPYNNKTYSLENLNGKLISYGKNTDNTSFYTPVYFEIDNEENLIPGSFIEVFLKSNLIPDAITVPYTAIMEEQGTYFVYIQISGETFEKREVRLGASDGINVQLLSGIQENERVVTKGAYRIKIASLAGALPDQRHVH